VQAFLSYNSNDKSSARRLGGQLKFVGADVWFDDWNIRAGDSIPGKVNEALEALDTVILVWSAHSDRSSWVRAELETAIMRSIDDGGFRVIPVRLDEAPLPSLLLPLKWVQLSEDDVGRAVNEIMGFAGDPRSPRRVRPQGEVFRGLRPSRLLPRLRCQRRSDPWLVADRLRLR
jgi:TIR domain